jgi:hypothetical protein
MGGKYYCATSYGDETNLQLYSLRVAKQQWDLLKLAYAEHGESTRDLKERCVLVLAVMGLSVSQLLGQNEPTPGTRVDFPIDIFNRFVDAHGLDQDLKARFARFNGFYNGCRHFGTTTTGSGYEGVDDLTFVETEQCYEFGLEVWRTVVEVWQKEKDSQLRDFEPEALKPLEEFG